MVTIAYNTIKTGPLSRLSHVGSENMLMQLNQLHCCRFWKTVSQLQQKLAYFFYTGNVNCLQDSPLRFSAGGSDAVVPVTPEKAWVIHLSITLRKLQAVSCQLDLSICPLILASQYSFVLRNCCGLQVSSCPRPPKRCFRYHNTIEIDVEDKKSSSDTARAK